MQSSQPIQQIPSSLAATFIPQFREQQDLKTDRVLWREPGFGVCSVFEHCVSSSSSFLSPLETPERRMQWAFPCMQAMLLQGWDTPDLALSAHLVLSRGKVLRLGSPLQWLYGASSLPSQSSSVLLSTAHHRMSFSTTQHANGLGLY